jgi:hypothetical protein
MTLTVLNTKVWYRLVKVLFVASFLGTTGIGLLIVGMDHPPVYSFAKDRTTLVCMAGNESVFKFSGLGSLSPFSAKPKYETLSTEYPGIFELRTTYDHEIAKYFQAARIPGSLPLMSDVVWGTLRQLCGLDPYGYPYDDSDSLFLKDVRSPRLLTMSEVAKAYPDWRKSGTVDEFYEGFKNALQADDPHMVGFANRIGERYGKLGRKLTRPEFVSLYWLAKPEWRALMKFSDLPESKIQEALKNLGAKGEDFFFLLSEDPGGIIAEGLVRKFPDTFQLVHAVPKLGTVNRTPHEFVFREMIWDGPILSRDEKPRKGCTSFLPKGTVSAGSADLRRSSSLF